VGLLDQPLRGVASTLIQKFGTSVVFRLKATGTFDETTDSAAVTEVDVTVKAVVAEYTRNAFEGRVKSGDKQLIVAAKDLSDVPDEEDEVFIDGSKHQVVMVRQIQATDQAAAYEIAARGV